MGEERLRYINAIESALLSSHFLRANCPLQISWNSRRSLGHTGRPATNGDQVLSAAWSLYNSGESEVTLVTVGCMTISASFALSAVSNMLKGAKGFCSTPPCHSLHKRVSLRIS